MVTAATPTAIESIERYVRLLWQPGDVRELRILGGGPPRVGYFDDPAALATAAMSFDGRANLYLTINPVDPTLLARAINRVKQSRDATADKDILVRRYLPIDIDPIRPSGISATDDEVTASLEIARAIAGYLADEGWGLPITSLSGNGHQLLYPVDLPNDRASTSVVAGVLAHLATRFDVEHVKVDTSVSNPARIMALIGTLKVKGDATAERPHRRSSLIHAPDGLVPVPLERLAALAPATDRQQAKVKIGQGEGLSPGWVRRWLDAAGVEYRVKPVDAAGVEWYGLASCPWHAEDGTPFECGVGEAPDVKGAAHCFHDRGAGKGWHDFRAELGLGPSSGSRSHDGAHHDDDDEAGDIPPDVRATVQPPPLASTDDILGAVARTVAGLGVAGEGRAIKLIYLVVVTRLLDRIVSLAVKGPSSAGKSFLVEVVLRLFPESACHVLSAFSERALIYDDAPLEHRMLVIYEAAGMAGDVQTYIVRSLLSEGRVRYITVEKAKGGLRPRTIDRKGPTGLITTTTEIHLHPENETRLMSLTISDTSEQTKAVLLAYATGAGAPVDLEPWHQLQEWLAQEPNGVVIPYVVTLATAIPPVAVRLRRDFPAVVALIKAHALLHQRTRERDDAGAVIATIGDYAAVRDLVADLVADAAERSVPDSVRETVTHVGTLTLAGGETTVQQLAQAMGLDKSAASRRVRAALDRGYLKNLEDKRGRPSRLVLGDPLPAEQTILPEPAELERLHGCSASEGDNAEGPSEPVASTDSVPKKGDHDPGATDTATAGDTPADEPATVQPSMDLDPERAIDDDASSADDASGAADVAAGVHSRGGTTTARPNALDIPSDEPATVQPPPPTFTGPDAVLGDDGPGPLDQDLWAEAEAAFAELGGPWVTPLPDDDRGAFEEAEEQPWP